MRSCLPALVLCLLLVAAPPTHADQLVLANGDVIHGTILETSDAEIVFEHDSLGRMTLELVQLQAESIDAAAEAAGDEVAEADPHPGIFGTRFLRGWEKQVGFGISGAEGNTKTTDLNTRVRFRVEDETRRWDLRASYFYSRNDGSASKNQAIVEGLRDFLLQESKWFFYMTSRYDWDDFEKWKHRIFGSAGVGYEFFKRETWSLRGRAGPGVTRTFGSENDWTAEAVANLDAEWLVTEGLKLEASNTVHPALNELGEFRNISRVTWTLDIPRGRGFKLAAGVINEYDSQNPQKKNDLKYLGTLLYDF